MQNSPKCTKFHPKNLACHGSSKKLIELLELNCVPGSDAQKCRLGSFLLQIVQPAIFNFFARLRHDEDIRDRNTSSRRGGPYTFEERGNLLP
jgi:hypothetical protein